MSEPLPDQRKVLQAARTGDLAAFETILSHYEKTIFNYLLRLVRSEADAADLAQETFIKFYKNLSRLDPDRSIKSWLFAIATNTARDWFRKRVKRPELFIIDDPEHPFETIAQEPSYYKIEATEDLKRALTRLKPVYQSVLLLAYKEELSYEEIAAALNIPLNTVKTHLYRAKLALRKTLEHL